jgi:[ribosomal protein S5]-alanine N-acetyltransferase
MKLLSSWLAPERDIALSGERVRLRPATMDATYSFLIFNDSAKLVGGINLSNIRRGVAQTGSLGYWIGEPFRRQGYMREALQAITYYSFLDLGLHRLEAACLPRNEASINLLRSCTFKPEGLARDYLKIAGIWEDHLLFAKLASDG